MKNIENFKNNFKHYRFNFNLKDEDGYVEFLASQLKDKVTDEQFNNAFNQIMSMSNEEYFKKYSGKYLTIADWLSLCGMKEESDDDVFNKAQDSFIDKCQEYLEPNFLCDFERKEFNESLTENESKALSHCGGISAMYSAVHSQDYAKRLPTALNDLKKAFNEVYNHERNQIKIEYNNENKKKLAGIAGNIFKQIGDKQNGNI